MTKINIPISERQRERAMQNAPTLALWRDNPQYARPVKRDHQLMGNTEDIVILAFSHSGKLIYWCAAYDFDCAGPGYIRVVAESTYDFAKHMVPV